MEIKSTKGGLEVAAIKGTDNGRLAEKLRSEYRNRGAALNGVEATSTSELMKRAQMGRDPKVNVSAEAFADRMQGRAFREAGVEHGTPQGAGKRNPSFAGGRNGASSKNHPSSSRAEDVVGKSTRNGGGKREESDAAEPARTSQRGRSHTYGGAYAGRRGGEEKRIPKEEPVHVRYAAEAEEDVFEEIRVERKRIPVGFLIFLLFFTVMIMWILASLAQIYQTTREISDMEQTVVTLKETIDDLELKLDAKNDIRLIEQMATAELGMVKEDSLQRKYTSC